MTPKLLAVLITDVSGYTAFTASAPREELSAAIRQQQELAPPIVKARRGRIVKWIGDAVLAVFESATDAVLCGHEIQRAFEASGRRGGSAPPTTVKAVVTLGDVGVDNDGDVYGEAVNLAARLEKVATAGEVFFTEAVRMAVSRADVPHERVGAYDFKGIADEVAVYRSAFGRSPSVSERGMLVFTDVAGVLKLADAHGWDLVHPVIDGAVNEIANAAREHGGTLRAVWGDGCFLTFATARGAIDAILAWERALAGAPLALAISIGMHVGEVRIMRHTTMGADVHITELLCGVAKHGEVLVTDEARAAIAEAEPGYAFGARTIDDAASKWHQRYGERAVWRLAR